MSHLFPYLPSVLKARLPHAYHLLLFRDVRVPPGVLKGPSVRVVPQDQSIHLALEGPSVRVIPRGQSVPGHPACPFFPFYHGGLPGREVQGGLQGSLLHLSCSTEESCSAVFQSTCSFLPICYPC